MFLPKRTAELFKLDTQTPKKSTDLIESNSEIKAQDENVQINNFSSQKSTSGLFPKRVNDLPPLESESEDENENESPNKNTKTQPNSRDNKNHVQEYKLTSDEPNNQRVIESSSEKNTVIQPNAGSVLKRTFTTGSMSSSNRLGAVSRTFSSTKPNSQPKLTELQVVHSFPAPIKRFSARKLFTPNQRKFAEIPLTSTKITPSIFRKVRSPDLFQDSPDSYKSNNNSGNCTLTKNVLEDTVFNEEPHYSRIFDVSVAVDKELPDVNIEPYSKQISEENNWTAKKINHLDSINECETSAEKFLETLFKKPETPINSVSTDSEIELSVGKTKVKSSIRINEKKYSLIRSIGKGGSAYVFEATAYDRRERGNKSFALKMVLLNKKESEMEQYKHEVKLLKMLPTSKYLVQYFASEISKDNTNTFGCIVMELGEIDLYQHLMSYKEDLPLYKLALWFHDMLEGVKVVHAHNIIHADLKPGNFIMSNGRLKLTDFGISMYHGSKPYVSEVVVAGTCNFLSPEAVHSVLYNVPARLTYASDIWSLGIIFYYLIYKILPFGLYRSREEKLQAILSKTSVISYPPLPMYYPEMLGKIIKDCLQYEPQKRPKAEELLSTYPFKKITPID